MRKRSLICPRGGLTFFLIILLTLTFGCADKERADLILLNGRIVTMDAGVPEAEALAIVGDTIVAVGTDSSIQTRFVSDNTIDCEERTIMPGIVESHGHLLSLGLSFLELKIENVSTPEEAVARVRERVAETPPGEWITGWGWDDGAWASSYPDNRELSAISPDNPVFLRGLHGFAGWANERALAAAGITEETPDPPEGRVQKDLRTGKPTGILVNAAQALLTSHIPALSQERIEEALELAIEECLKQGLTTIHEARTTGPMLEALRTLNRAGRLKSRIYVMVDWEDEELLAKTLAGGPEIDPASFLTVRCIKIFVDGALGSRGAAMLEPYSDAPEERGVIVTDEDDLTRLTIQALERGFQVAVHAIGDRANRITLNAFRRALEAISVSVSVPNAGDHRLRLEHAQVVALDDIPAFAPLDIVLSMQPPHCTSDMPWVEARIGKERVLGAYAWRSFLDTGVHLTLNSDFPGETLDPFDGMYAALTRMTPQGEPEGGWFPDQRLTREEVLRAYTVEAAYSGFEEDIKGRIAPGFLADIIVLSDDILEIPIHNFLGLDVEQVYVGGKRVR